MLSMTRRQFSAALAATLVVPKAAWAQAYPARPIRLVVPYAAGGGTDAIARIMAQKISEHIGQTMVVENIGTAGGNVATTTVAGAAPDGYTILMANQGPMAVNPHLFKSLKIDTLKAFRPITLVASAPLVAVVPAGSPYKTLQDLVAAAQNAPGKLNYGSAGNGSASHLATVLLNLTAKMDTVHLAYRGAGPAIIDLLGGQAQFMVTTIPSVTGLLTSGKLRPLAVTGKERSPLFKDVPTVAESGYPEYEASAWYGFVAPHETRTEVIGVLHKATTQALADETVRSRLAADGAVPVGNSAEEFGAFIKTEYKRWKGVIAAANIRLD